MFHIVLYQPEIPPNTGNIIRLSANTGCQLHLIKPLGFALEEKRLRRAGLDYHEWASVAVHENFDAFYTLISSHIHSPRIFACTSKTNTYYHEQTFQFGDIFLFGPETRGLPEEIKTHPTITAQIKIPMQTPSRSLNLSNSAAIIIYEAWRQCGFQSS